jgi:hypothetical protein
MLFLNIVRLIVESTGSAAELVSVLQDECGCVSYQIKIIFRPHCDACVFLPGHLSNYGLVKQKKTFAAAENFCQQNRGHLASFKSLGEALMISEGLHALRAQEGNSWSQSVRTGGKGEGTYYSFTDGSPFSSDICTTPRCGQPWITKWGYPMYGFQSTSSVTFYIYGSTSPSDSMHDNISNSGEHWFLCKF